MVEWVRVRLPRGGAWGAGVRASCVPGGVRGARRRLRTGRFGTRCCRADLTHRVVGAGMSGLIAALTLHDTGIAATVYEASGRVGGRMHSDTTSWLNGQTSEHCGELIDSAHTSILSLAQRFNIHTVDLHAAEPLHSTETYFFDKAYYSKATATRDFRPVFRNLKTDNNAAPFPTLFNSFTQAGYDLDHLTLYDWIESRVPGGHSSKLGQLLDVAYTQLGYGKNSKLQLQFDDRLWDRPGQWGSAPARASPTQATRTHGTSRGARPARTATWWTTPEVA